MIYKIDDSSNSNNNCEWEMRIHHHHLGLGLSLEEIFGNDRKTFLNLALTLIHVV